MDSFAPSGGASDLQEASSRVATLDRSPEPLEGPDRHHHQHQHNAKWSSAAAAGAAHGHAGLSRPFGCVKRGGRPVTWIGGGGMDPKKLAGMGVRTLRALFSQVFGEATASNNAGWLRRKLAEAPNIVHGQRRSAVVRARDMGAAIWNGGSGRSSDAGAGDESQGPHGDDGGDFEPGVDCEPPGGTFYWLQQLQQQQQQPSLASGESAGSQREAAAMAPPSPSGSGSTSPAATHAGAATASGASPRVARSRAADAGQRRRHGGGGAHAPRRAAQQQQQQQQCAASWPEAPGGICCGARVRVYWPEDRCWYPATVCGLDVSARWVQLLYADMTEEVVRGADFDGLLANRHLLLDDAEQDVERRAADVAGSCGAPGASAAAQISLLPIAQPAMAAAAAAALCPVQLQGASAMELPTTCWLDAPATTLAATGTRSQSCLLPAAAFDAAVSPRELSRSASATFCAPPSCGDGERHHAAAALLRKRPFRELSAGTPSGSDGTTNAPDATAAGDMAALFAAQLLEQPLQLQQGAKASQLGAEFAQQQRQQQQLQLLEQGNRRMQQQAQLQMHQQMAVHMSLQQAAGQMHLAVPALSAPGAGLVPARGMAATQRGQAAAVASPSQSQQLADTCFPASACDAASPQPLSGLAAPRAGPAQGAGALLDFGLGPAAAAAASARAGDGPGGLPPAKGGDAYVDMLLAHLGMGQASSRGEASADVLADDGGGDSSCGGASLCEESVADELAVAGLGADDAAGYFLLDGPGSPTAGAAAAAAAAGDCGGGCGGDCGCGRSAMAIDGGAIAGGCSFDQLFDLMD